MLSTEATVLTQSHLATFARCERRSYYRDVLKLDEGPSGAKSSEGTLLHAGLAAAFRTYKDGRSVDICQAAGMTAMSEMLAAGTYEYRGQEQTLSIKQDDGETITRLGDVFLYYMSEQFRKDVGGAKVLAVEQPYDLTIAGITLSGTFDLVLERGGVIEVWDHKSVSDVHKSLRFLTLDVQVLVYELIAQTAIVHAYNDDETSGTPLVQMVYNLVRRDRPPGFGSRELRRNKDGTVSKTNASTNVNDYLLQHRFGHTYRELLHVTHELEELAYGVMNHWKRESPGKRTVIKSGGEACATSCPYFARCGADLVGAAVPNFVGLPEESTEDSD